MTKATCRRVDLGLWFQRDGPLSQADMAASCTCDSQTEVLRGYIFDAKHKAERKLKVGWDYGSHRLWYFL